MPAVSVNKTKEEKITESSNSMSSPREKYLLNALNNLVLYAGGSVSKQVRSIKNVVYQGRTTRRKVVRKPERSGSAVFRSIASTPITDYGRTRTMMAG